MPLDGAYCNALLLAHWSNRQKLNHVSSVQIIRLSVRALTNTSTCDADSRPATATISQVGKMLAKIKILNTHNLLCRKFAAVYRNFVENLDCQSENCNFLPVHFWNPRRRCLRHIAVMTAVSCHVTCGYILSL